MTLKQALLTTVYVTLLPLCSYAADLREIHHKVTRHMVTPDEMEGGLAAWRKNPKSLQTTNHLEDIEEGREWYGDCNDYSATTSQ